MISESDKDVEHLTTHKAGFWLTAALALLLTLAVIFV